MNIFVNRKLNTKQCGTQHSHIRYPQAKKPKEKSKFFDSHLRNATLAFA